MIDDFHWPGFDASRRSDQQLKAFLLLEVQFSADNVRRLLTLCEYSQRHPADVQHYGGNAQLSSIGAAEVQLEALYGELEMHSYTLSYFAEAVRAWGDYIEKHRE